MADPSTCPPLTPTSIRQAYQKIKPYIHKTPLITSTSLDAIASSTDPSIYLSENPPPFTPQEVNGHGTTDGGGASDDVPRFRLCFKCENAQKIGAFKARGAFHAVSRLDEELGIEEVRRRGVVTHSSGEFRGLPYLALLFALRYLVLLPHFVEALVVGGLHSLFSSNSQQSVQPECRGQATTDAHISFSSYSIPNAAQETTPKPSPSPPTHSPSPHTSSCPRYQPPPRSPARVSTRPM